MPKPGEFTILVIFGSTERFLHADCFMRAKAKHHARHHVHAGNLHVTLVSSIMFPRAKVWRPRVHQPNVITSSDREA